MVSTVSVPPSEPYGQQRNDGLLHKQGCLMNSQYYEGRAVCPNSESVFLLMVSSIVTTYGNIVVLF